MSEKKKDKAGHKKKEKNEGETKDIYFMILYPRKEQEKPEEFVFSENNINPQNIYTNEIKNENGTYLYQKVFKFNGKEKKYTPEFEIGKDNYIITFEAKENSFIYDVELKKGNKILKNIAKANIDQKIKDYDGKLDIFLEALKSNNEEGKKETLYKDTIDIFGKKKGFGFLISLFAKIYKEKELCSSLIAKFKDMNNNSKDNEKNLDRNKDLEKYIDTFKAISSEAENEIKTKGYDPIQFYGIILCYLNYYDHTNFIEALKKIFAENSEVLYEILLIYYSHFLNSINQDFDFFVQFIEYCASKKEFKSFKNGLNYIRDIETFISVINKTKETIVEKYVTSTKSFEPIKLAANLDLIKKPKNKEIEAIIFEIRSIKDYSKEKKVLLVYFTSTFWIKILKDYNIPDEINIKNCYELRKIFFEYNDLVNELYKKDKNSEIKKDINKYYERDEFAFTLDKNIKKLLDNNAGLSNSEKLGFVEDFNPYYKEDKYSYKRDTYIFDYINLDDNSEEFIETFKKLDFETMFKDKIIEFLNVMTSKIKNISNFGTILELIEVKKITEIDEFFRQLKDKYEQIKRQLDSLNDKDLNKAVKILAKFVDMIFVHEKNCNFIQEKINKLDKQISSLIYNELMRRCKGDEYKSMKELIYQKFLNKLENINNIIELIESLDEKDKKEFLEELLKKCQFEKEDYYSENENKKIDLLCELNDKGKLQKSEEQGQNKYYVSIEKTIQKIYNDLDGEILIKKLEEFLGIKDEKIVIKRLGLIKLIYADFDPETLYGDLKKKIDQIKKDINELNLIKSSLLIFYRNKHQKEIRDISKIINDMQEKNLNNYKAEKTQLAIKDLKNLKDKVEEVENVKDFLLFKVLYNEAYGNDQESRFNDALKKLDNIKGLFANNATAEKLYQENKEIFDKIKEMLSNNESKSEKFFEDMKKYFKIEEKQKNLINELTLIFKSKKYEMDLKSIIYFFENLKFPNTNNEDTFKEKIPSKYKKLSEMNLEDLKQSLKELKTNGIYDYEETNKNYKLFTSLYEKKEAIDFLISKTNESNTNQNISSLYKKIDPTNRTITIKNIEDTEKCIKIFIKLKELNDNNKIFEYIKKELKEEDISVFEMFSKNYSSIIELERNDDSSLNLFNQVNDYIQDAIFIFRQDNEDFSYGKDKKTSMDELIHIKNKIHIKPPKGEINPKDEFQEKCLKLVFFKELISDLEVIYEYMKFLRLKGSSLPILISIQIKYPNIEYKLNKKKTDFKFIKNDFLFPAKNDYIVQLDSVYKQQKYIRFLFGKLFRNIMRHLSGGHDVSDIIRFILNKTDSTEKIKDGKASNPLKAEDYVKQYKIYTDNSFKNISNYLTSLFENNKTSLQKHYETMLIKEKMKYKGIYLHKCENESMEEFIVNIYLEKMNQLPLAQNVLISCKETSLEEMQAFFYRAILCDYNTLFVVEINDSFSDFMQNTMFTYIDSLLTYKNEKYKEYENKQNVDKTKTKEYLNSCIIFVYNDENLSFLNEIKRFEPLDIPYKALIKNNGEQDTDTSVSNFASQLSLDTKILDNIKVITSDICGLGKTYKIKKMIETNKKNYFHFPLGGILSKSIIFKKLSKLLDKVREKFENNYQDVAIHLDLTESKETSIINDFFFSFLITKFYTNNENIIYIPKEIDIYIEIPNCFENYMSKFGILNAFIKENISLDKKEELNLPQKDIEFLQNKIDISSNDEKEVNSEIKKFFKNYISIDDFSYHQLNIFIKLFISQYNDFDKKLKQGQDDENEKNFKEFVECAKYFISGGFIKLLMNKNEDNTKKNDYIDLLSDIYEKDLNETKFDAPLIFFKENNIRKEQISSKENKSSKEYLEIIKGILDLPNEVENDVGETKSLLKILDYKTDNYVITNDNFKKMLLLIYRIRANIPVIIMGETGCGKTALITKLNQILNNGEITVKIINIHPGITDEDICKDMREIDEEAKKNDKNEIWAFFDEINTCLSLSLLTEIFIHRTYNGEKLSDNIRLIGACNPYRRRKALTEKCGLSRDDDNENELVYLVQPLPQSLLYYVFSFGRIKEDDEKKYIYSIIEKLFKEENEKNLHKLTGDAILECHKFLREAFDPSVVSLREISRFSKCVEFFQEYFKIKNDYENEINENRADNNNNESKKRLYKIKSIICSIYLCYYIRLIDEEKRSNFNYKLRDILLNIVNDGQKKDNEKAEAGELVDQIKYDQLRNDLKQEPISQFSDFLKIEEDFLLDKIELDKGIGKNNLLRENTFLLFLAVITNIPLIIVGKPGTGKSLSAQLIYKAMRGIYSKNKFFQKFPKIIQTYFQGSESTQPEDVEKLFEIAGKKLEYYKNNMKKEELPISMILFDELGLAEKSETNPLKVLHSKLEYTGKEEGVSFIGISNYSLDAAKVNRALYLSVPNLEDKIDQLQETSKSIVESISKNLSDHAIFEILAKAYYEYKNILNFIKELTALKQFDSDNKKSKEPIDIKKKTFTEIKDTKEFKNLLKKEKKIKVDFHGNRDLYNFIKGIAKEIGRLDENGSGEGMDHNRVVLIVENNIERNFGGIDYEIDIDLSLKLADIEGKFGLINEILQESINNTKKNSKQDNKNNNKKAKSRQENKNKNENKEKTKITSVFLFKKIYNHVCEEEELYKIQNSRIARYDLNECINENINDINNRYLLLEIRPSLASLIYQNIRIQNPDKVSDFYEGSPFIDDNNNEYKFKIINDIQDDAKTDKLIIFQNLNQIQPFLYDLYNMNYIIKDEQKFARICLDNFSEQLTPVNDNFRIIILVDRKFIDEVDIAFLNRLEKMKITFDQLLDNEQMRLTSKIIDEINFKYNIEKCQKQINYSLRDLLINCGTEEIEGLIYNYSIKNRNNNNKIDEEKITERVYDKISNILPQDIICILPDNNIIKRTYYEKKKYYNLKSYINDEDNKKYKISIIYTFHNIANLIDGINVESSNKMSIMISEIKSEKQLENIINEIKTRNDSNRSDKRYEIVIHFEQFYSKQIQFISNFIFKYFKEDKYNYIFLIHIKRNFDNIKERIYSIPDINPDINQLFIDNLNGTSFKLNDLLEREIKDIMDSNEINLEREFKRTLTSFIYKEYNEKKNNQSSFFNENNSIEDNYIEEIPKYMEEDVEFKEKIIDKVKDLINNDKDSEGNCKSLIEKIFKMNYIGKNSIDIISSLLDYIKEQIFSKYLKHILEVLEDNNILTTLFEIKKNNNNSLDEDIIVELRDNFLNKITMEKKNFVPKFLSNYKIPGFYNFYKFLSDYINKNITIEYFNNEKKLREYVKSDAEKQKIEFHKKEEDFLSSVYDTISEDKYIFDTIKKIPDDLVLKDYITYYLDKNNSDNSRNEINHQIIELLLNLRFNEKNEIIKNNRDDSTKILLIKIMWMESNVNYILSLLKLFSLAKQVFNDDGKKLYEKIEEIIKDEKKNIKYITNETRNPEHTREVNECYYIISAILCLCVTSEEIKLTESLNFEEVGIERYCEVLKNMNNILQILNSDLKLYLNEMYIIDELIKVIDLQRLKAFNSEKLEEIRKYLIENVTIIQNDQPDKIDELIINLQNIYESLTSEEVKKEDDIIYYNKYYDTLKYILLKEINKISDPNYRSKILEKILQEKEIIKKSNDIFDILLKKYISVKTGDKEFKKNLSYISKGDNEIINLIEYYLSDNKKEYYIALSETLLLFFEKNSIIYLNNALYDKKEPILLEKEPLDILKDCTKFLNDFIEHPKEIEKKKIKNISKLFCIGYIKAFCSTFVKMFDEPEPKFKEPETIINAINDNKLKKIIILYIYKILFNQYQIDVFVNSNYKRKYKVDKYKGFENFKKNLEEEKINYGMETLDNENYEKIYKAIEKYKKDNFTKKIQKDEIDYENLIIDNFYIASNNLILSHLKWKDFEKSEIYDNFYKNICKPLFEKDKDKDKSFNLIQFLFNPKEYEKIEKEYGINHTNIEALLYGYRFCLNEASDEKENGIYSTLYDKRNVNYLAEKFYPGSDTKNEPHYELYSKILNHFEKKQNEGCYVCLCEKGFYHSVPSGFPGVSEGGMKCLNCQKEIGAKVIKTELENKIEIVKRDKYYRIFKDKEEIEKVKLGKNSNKLEEINYMTLEEFKERYIQKLLSKEKGLPNIDKNYFKRDDKIIRKLNQISYRLLNYILYSHLFFARLITKTKKFDNYLPKGMNWGETLNECWILLKNELSKKEIDTIDIFINLTFKDLFNKLQDKECIDNIDDLIDFENDLEQLINEKIDLVKKENEKYKKFIKDIKKDKNSSFYLLTEAYESQDSIGNDYPFFEYFYYCDYLDEKYINEKLSHMDENKYPILKKYLEYKKNNSNKNDDYYSLDNLYLFNTVLNLFSEKYK